MTLAAYRWLRAQEITDGLIELVIQIIHRIGTTAERRVERKLIGTLKRVARQKCLTVPIGRHRLCSSRVTHRTLKRKRPDPKVRPFR
jgi:hypothetical protein